MKARGLVLCMMLVCGSTGVTAADSPTPDAVVEGAIRAAGGPEALSRLGVLKMIVTQEETLSSGEQVTNNYTGHVDTSNFANMRIDLPKGLVIASHNGVGWSTKGGKLDDRRQTPRMALGAIHQRLFPLLLPFSLDMAGVHLKDVSSDSFDNEDVWRLIITFDKMFFISPAMSVDWSVMIRKRDHAVLAAEFLPPYEYREVDTEGIRYRLLRHSEVGGVRLPSNLLLDGIHSNGVETGHVRITKVELSAQEGYDAALFVNPKVLEALEEGVPGINEN